MTTLDKGLAMINYDALLAELWDQPEDRVDFKEPFLLDSTSQKQVYGLIKDILGMSNREGGGFIIIGKKDGTKEAIECSDEIIRSFDSTKVHDQAKSHGKPEPIFNVYSGVSPEGTRAIIIHVKEFVDTPVICSKNLSINGEKGLILRAGAIYIRSKTGSAQTGEISTEQDMRDLINRAILKNGEKLTSAISLLIGRYAQGEAIDPLAKRESLQNWQREQVLLDKKLATLPPLSDPILQIFIHPSNYEKNLFDTKSLQSKLNRSCFFHGGWSFPCPDFEISKGSFDLSDGCLVHASNKRYADGELHSVFAMSTSGLVTYREELTSAYDTNRSGKPFLILQAFLTAYRAVGFLGQCFNFMPKSSKFKITISVSNIYERIPCTHVFLPLDQPMPFFKATEISAPKISFEIEVNREEASMDIIGTTLKIAKKIVEFTDAQVSDKELKAEIEKIANLS